jgi:glutamyl/glutaminyl-tRNA synthetase
MSEVRARFAPSPTGYLHIGSARTALFNWLFARHEGGKFYLRIEDTDKERSKQEFLDEIVSSLKWLGMDWDGELVFQSKRTPYYQEMAKNLLDKGVAYKDGEAILLKVAKTGKVSFDDLLHGKIEYDLDQHVSLAEDLVIFKSDGSPTYNFAVVCDDQAMGITHVIRGDDHINNTPKQLSVYEALGFKPPIFCHIPLILGPDRSRMSKRHGATSIREYMDQGFLPEAIVNYLSLLGWSPGNNQELIDRKELVQKFELKRVARLEDGRGVRARQIGMGERAVREKDDRARADHEARPVP